ncbi:phosphotransferase, partial [Chloroflexota bacterium]
WAEGVQQRIPGYAVQIPEVQWINASLGMLATRWIPGRNLDTTLCSESRLWSLHSSEGWNIKIIKLIEWLESFSRVDQELSHFNPIDRQDDTNWDRWTSWLAEANHFEKEWRIRVIPELHNLRHKVKQKGAEGSFQHGDFAPWNVRFDPEGNIYVMDWGGMEIRDWLSPAYRFYYALRISALSPLAKRGYYKSIYENIAEFIKTRQPDEEIRRYYRARAVLQNIKFLCRGPARTPKMYMRIRFLIKELNLQLEASLDD